MAESARATSFGYGLDQQPYSLQTAKSKLPEIQTRNYLSPRLQPSSIPSLDEINTLESTLSGYKTQLATLKTQAALSNKDLAAPIKALSNKIEAYEAAIVKAKADYADFTAAQQTLKSVLSRYESSLLAEQAKLTAKSGAQRLLDEARTTLEAKQAIKTTAQSVLDEAQQAYEAAQKTFNEADASLTQQKQITSQALSTLTLNQELATQAAADLQSAQQTLNEAQQNLDAAAAQLSAATQTFNVAQQNLNTAQDNYDNNLIPDPDWTAPTYQKEHIRTITNTRTVEVKTLVPHTTTTLQEQVIPNLLFNSDFSRGTEGWSGVNPGWQGSNPALIDGEIIFSYQNQTVSQGLFSGPFQNATLTLSADWFNNDSNTGRVDNYSMTVEAKDINQNTVGSATYTSTGAHDWDRKSVSLTATGPVSYVTVSFSGIDNGFWYGIYGPHFKNPTLQISHGQMVTETTYEEVITYEEETYYTYETYYTTELVQPQTGLTVKVYNQLPTSNPQRSDTAYNLCKTTTLTSINHNWSGGDILGCGSDRVMIHYTGYITPTENITSLMGQADDGFYLNINGSNVINNWTLKGCGGNWNPVTLEKGKTYEIDAWFFEWGGGACSILNYQSNNGSGVVPEAWYTNAISAPLIKDSSLLPLLEVAQSEYDEALAQKQAAQDLYDDRLSTRDSSEDAVSTASASLETINEVVTTSNSIYNTEATKSQELETTFNESVKSLTAAEGSKTTATSALDQASTEVLTNEEVVTTASSELEEATTSHEEAVVATAAALTSKATAEVKLEEAQTSNQKSIQTAKAYTAEIPETLNEVETELAKPDPVPEEGSKEIPTELSAKNLMDVNLEAVDPTELTEAQAEQLVEAALETFLTAEEGSPEYEQALDALYLAAEQDDIELSPELAAIPGLAGAVELINFFGNAGADMSPKVREESEKIVVTAVVAAGAAIQSAAAAASTASASSGGSRRIGK